MDKIDKKIITLLQQNARMPLKAPRMFSFHHRLFQQELRDLRKKRLLKDMKLRLIS